MVGMVTVRGIANDCYGTTGNGDDVRPHVSIPRYEPLEGRIARSEPENVKEFVLGDRAEIVLCRVR